MSEIYSEQETTADNLGDTNQGSKTVDVLKIIIITKFKILQHRSALQDSSRESQRELTGSSCGLGQ